MNKDDVIQQNINNYLTDIENITVEMHSLIRQGVKELIDQRLEQRGELLEALFQYFSEQETVPTDAQQVRLESLLSQDQASLSVLNKEQMEYQKNNRKKSKLKLYNQNFNS